MLCGEFERAARRVIASGLILATVVGGRAAQDPAPQASRPQIFRAGATFVSVDVYPRREGQFLDGLTSSDFQVFEDGKPQRIETFSLIRFTPMPVDGGRRDPAGLADAERQAGDPRNRVFVVYLDLYHTTVTGSHNARQPVVNFLNRTIGASDLFGVLTPEIPVRALTFGRRTETIEAELTKEWFWGQANDWGGLMRTPAERMLQTCVRNQQVADRLVRRHREDLLLTSLENLVIRLDALRDERKHVLFLSEGWVPEGSDRGLLPDLSGLPAVGLGRGVSQADEAGRERFCAESMAHLAMEDFRIRFQSLLTAASRANVSFHPVDVGGLKGPAIANAQFTPSTDADVAARESQSRARLNTLRDMAGATDGRAVVRTNDLDGGMRRIADDLQAFYLLGYYSTNPAADGRFRKIEVKVAQPGLSLRARRGYLAPTEAMVRAVKAGTEKAEKSPPLLAVAPAVTDALSDLVRLRAEAVLHGYGVRTAAGLSVTLELTSRELVSGRWRKGGEAELSVTSPGAAAPITVRAPFPPGARSVMVAAPLRAEEPGPWRVRSRLTAGTQVLEQPLEVNAPPDALLGGALCSAPPRQPVRRSGRRPSRCSGAPNGCGSSGPSTPR